MFNKTLGAALVILAGQSVAQDIASAPVTYPKNGNGSIRLVGSNNQGVPGDQLVFLEGNSAVVVFTMRGVTLTMDQSSANQACGKQRAVLQRWYQVAVNPGGGSGSRTYVAICKKF